MLNQRFFLRHYLYYDKLFSCSDGYFDGACFSRRIPTRRNKDTLKSSHERMDHYHFVRLCNRCIYIIDLFIHRRITKGFCWYRRCWWFVAYQVSIYSSDFLSLIFCLQYDPNIEHLFDYFSSFPHPHGVWSWNYRFHFQRKHSKMCFCCLFSMRNLNFEPR